MHKVNTLQVSRFISYLFQLDFVWCYSKVVNVGFGLGLREFDSHSIASCVNDSYFIRNWLVQCTFLVLRSKIQIIFGNL